MASDFEHLSTSGLHVVSKDLLELEPPHGVETLRNKLHAGNVGELLLAIAAVSGLLLGVVKVVPCEEVTKDEGGDVAIVLLVHHDRNAVVKDGDGVGLGVHGHLETVHVGIAPIVVGRVDQDLLKDLVEAWGKRHVLPFKTRRCHVKDKEVLGHRFDQLDVRVRPQHTPGCASAAPSSWPADVFPWRPAWSGGSWRWRRQYPTYGPNLYIACCVAIETMISR